jgi:hypothetical protein
LKNHDHGISAGHQRIVLTDAPISQSIGHGLAGQPSNLHWFVHSDSGAGRPVSTEDAQIAAIALAANLTLVTRSAKDFEVIDGLQVIKPRQMH